MKIINQDEYGSTICQWFHKEFYKLAECCQKEIVDIITTLIISTKDNRYGPIPNPESQVIIRDVIRKSIKLNIPIPFLTGWGGRKPFTVTGIDVAEVLAINQILTLNRCIKKYYEPGIKVNIRVEDTGANWLYRKDPTNKVAVKEYSNNFSKLIDILQDEPVITIKKESDMMEEQSYFNLSSQYSKYIFDVLTLQIAYPDKNIEETPEYQKLNNIGWRGIIPKEQRDYYLNRYKHLCPNLNEEEYVNMLSDYFGGSKARYDLNGTGKPITEIGNHIHLTFVAPVPGVPESLFNNAVYWRTLPATQGRTHISPWRAKGYFKINGEITGKITSFRDPLIEQLTPSFTILQKEKESLKIQTDYLLV
ncbi:MAG: hypothetical protein PHF86_01655 [Candidatus Nanoarchaeia archaeon]|nr:hypothetical protein [Candidatus Nanoarchaeia archaeon]